MRDDGGGDGEKSSFSTFALFTHLDAVLEAVKLPAAVSGLDTGLSHVDGDTLCAKKGQERRGCGGNKMRLDVCPAKASFHINKRRPRVHFRL